MSTTTLMLLAGIPFAVMGVLFVLTFVVMAAARRKGVQAVKAPVDTPMSERVRAFKAAGDHASAVALVQAETGMSPVEAVRFVDAVD